MIIIIIIIIVPAMFTVYQPQGMQKEFTKCAAAFEQCRTLFGQRKCGEHTIVLIVCRKKSQSLVELDESEAAYSQTTYPTYIHT